MKTRLIYIIIVQAFLFVSCGEIKIGFKAKPSDDNNVKYKQCEQCKIQPRSGNNRDLRYGYYFDIKESKCKMISYSTGDGSIPPPFSTMEECKSCCGN
ncbi:MAG: hypothetical protein HC905_25355 [Bacteroidales bacterium]|nr:hypothetical protein [Bacteroidales bacterium]